MESLDTQAAVDALCERFSDFFDAVLIEVVLHLPRQARDRQAELRLACARQEGDLVVGNSRPVFTERMQVVRGTCLSSRSVRWPPHYSPR